MGRPLAIYFADKIMQSQYEDLRKQGVSKKMAVKKVKDAHNEYLGAKIY